MLHDSLFMSHEQYIQIKQVQNAYKSNIQDGTAEVIFDQVKNFSHEVSRKKDSPGKIF